MLYRDHNLPDMLDGSGRYISNFDTEKDYGHEYADVHFRVRTLSYDGGFSPEARQAYDADVTEAFSKAGWTVSVRTPEWSGCCPKATRGKERLYLHPQDFSGYVLKNTIRELAKTLRGKTFVIESVDIYQDVLDLDDEAYLAGLREGLPAYRRSLFESLQTNRRDRFFQSPGVIDCEARKLTVLRLCQRNLGADPVATRFVEETIRGLVEEGYLVQVKSPYGVFLLRSLNKGEMKSRKLPAL